LESALPSILDDLGGWMDLSLIKAGESYADAPGLPELARYGHLISPDRFLERIAVQSLTRKG
jgi:hypothetical protein